MRLDQFWSLLQRRLPLAVVIFLLVTVGTAAWSFTRTPVYTATSEVYVTIAPTKSSGTLNQDAQYVLGKVKSYTEIATTPAVLDRAATALNDAEVTAASLSDTVTATNDDGTTIISIQATNRSGAVAARIADAVAAQLSPTIRRIEPASSSSGIKASVVRGATAPTSPTFPRNNLNIVLGVIAGLLLGAGIAVGTARLDQSVRTAEEMEALVRAAPIGTVGYDRAFRRKAVVVGDSKSMLTEDYRTIRARLAFAGVDSRLTKIVVTSSVPGEGKSTVAVNLAIVLAQGGARVCLVEGDVRRPKVSEYLGIDHSIGLTDVLVGHVDLRAALVDWANLLTVLPAGTNPPDPGELFASARMRSLMDELGDRFDYVICDTPPLLSVADAAIIARTFDGALLVARSGSTTRGEITKALDGLRASEARVLGTILNGVPRGRGRKSYDYSPVQATA